MGFVDVTGVFGDDDEAWVLLMLLVFLEMMMRHGFC